MSAKFEKKCKAQTCPLALMGLTVIVLAMVFGLGIVCLIWDGPTAPETAGTPERGVAQAALSDVYKDVVTTKSYYDLPAQIRSGLGYSQSEVKSVVYAEASLITKTTSFVLTVSDTISRLSGIIIGGAQSKQEVKKALESTMAQELIAKGGTVGEVVVTLYKIDDAGNLVQTAIKAAKTAKNAATAPLIAAQAVSMVLDAEMTYINNNLSGGLKNLWTLNPFSTGRLKLYIVFVGASNKGKLEDVRGIRFYYFKDKTQSWVNYYNDLVGSDVLLRK